VSAELADSDEILHERIASLEEDVQCYRLLAQQAIHALYEFTKRVEASRARYERLVDEYRTLREQVLKDAGR